MVVTLTAYCIGSTLFITSIVAGITNIAGKSIIFTLVRFAGFVNVIAYISNDVINSRERVGYDRYGNGDRVI